MDKLMNAANASTNESKPNLKDGEYVFYATNRPQAGMPYKLRFMGESPADKNMLSISSDKLGYYEDIAACNKDRPKKDPRNVLDGLYEDEMPGYCIIKNGVLYLKRLYATNKLTKKRVMMVSIIPEFVMEDMSTYKIPKWSNSNDVGSAGWFMQKYINKPEDCTVLNALIFNDVLVDIEWERATPTWQNLLDRLQYFVQNIGWTPDEIVNYLATGNKNGGY